MSLDGLARQLLDELIYQHGFPPRAAAAQIKGRLALQGLGHSSGLAQEVGSAYVGVVERVLDDFTERVISRSAALGLRTADEVRAAVSSAHQELFDLARGLVRDEVPGAEYGNHAAATIDARRMAVRQHLERRIELQALEAAPARPAKELDQKFRILLSPGQAEQDFDVWVEMARALGNPVAVLFLDLDNFKALNTRFTNAKVDQTILPDAQRLTLKLVQGRGEAYLHGGDEMVLVAPNLDDDEARALAEKVRRSFEGHKFVVDSEPLQLTVSVGVATWPVHGSTYQAVLEAANRAQVDAKRSRNVVVVAGS